MVIARVYGITVVALFTLVCCYYVYLRPSYQFDPLTPYETPSESKVISVTWEEFLGDCGGEVIVENFVHARSVFNEKYENNQIEWKGVFAELKQTAQTLPFVGTDHAMNLLVKMEPTESVLYPDLVLSISS